MSGEEDREMARDGDGQCKKAHHNALERQRRDQIKDSFSLLKDEVPSAEGLKGEKTASKALILKKAADCITLMEKKNSAHEKDIVVLEKQNHRLETQIRRLQSSALSEDDYSDESSDDGLYEERFGHLGRDRDSDERDAEIAETF